MTGRERREAFMARMEGGVAILRSAPISARNADTDYEYRQDSDFYYLTRFPEPEAVAVFAPERKGERYTLFCRPKDPDKEVWTGRRAGVEGAVEQYGADKAYKVDELDQKLPELLGNARQLYYAFGGGILSRPFDERVIACLARLRGESRRGIAPPPVIRDPGEIVHEMRLRKSEEELLTMRRAADITREAHLLAMEAATPGLGEWEVEALIEGCFRRRGAQSPAYPSIVGSGPNGCTLHYNENSRRLRAGELLLVDAGCELDFYAADVTRTYPCSGRFTEAQRRVYDVVLRAQKEAIALAGPGVRFDEVHDLATFILTEGMVELGLLKGDPKELIEKGEQKKFYMHRTSHWLGMDVHDVGHYRKGEQWRMLEPGMVLTVEPGIYVAERAEGVDPAFWNIGVRIEDDVLVTAEGREVLTAAIPKEVEDLEALVGRAAAPSLAR